jgi:ATP-dependent DNA ligase
MLFLPLHFIGGYTPPGGSRKYFGALLVGYYGARGLLFAGSVVGTGFSERALERFTVACRGSHAIHAPSLSA